MKRIIIFLLVFATVLSSFFSLYFYDPAFTRSVKFGKYEETYEWRVFNNSYCNFSTDGHCHTNETNQFNAEIRLARKLLNLAKSDHQISEKLIEIVKNKDWYFYTYSKLTRSEKVELDSLIKYREEVFRPLLLK